MSSGKWRSFCLGLNMFNLYVLNISKKLLMHLHSLPLQEIVTMYLAESIPHWGSDSIILRIQYHG